MTLYDYSCVSKSGHAVTGRVNLQSQLTRDELTSEVLSRVAHIAFDAQIPWDPFNIELIIKVQAQSEPKPQKFPEV